MRYCFASLLTALLLTASAHADLAGFWQFDGNGNDASGSGNNATLTNGPTYSPIVPPLIGSGTSLLTNGNNQFATIAPNTNLNSSNFTLSYWINQNGTAQNGGFERVTSRGGDTFETAVSGTGALSFYNPAAGWNTTAATVPLNGWTNVTWRVDGAAGRVQLFTNGNLVHTRTGGALGAISGLMNIGARHTGNEGFQGLTDNVSLFDTSLNGGAIALMASGITPDVIASDVTQQSIVSNTSQWMRSTVTQDGGPGGTWTAGAIVPPAANTFTLPTSTAGVPGGITTAAGIIGGGAQAIVTDNNVTFFRTTFELDAFDEIAAQLQLAVDNGMAVFLNGNEIARETSFVVDNWNNPLPGLTINPDGTISGVVKLDMVDPSFSGFVAGTNEIILAVRNPNSEGANSGGFAFRLDVATTAAAVPEPATWLTWITIAATTMAVAVYRRRRKS